MTRLLAVMLLCCAAPGTAEDQPRILGLAEVLRRAQAASPDLRAARQREAQAGQAVGISKSDYYPSLELEGVQSYGFPGSSSGLGAQGLDGSPYRDGPGGALVSRLSLFDLGRRSRLDTAQAELQAARERTKVVRFEVYQEALQIYFDGVRTRGQREVWQGISREIALVAEEVERLVRTGQHPLVEKLLVADQDHDAAMARASYEARYRLALRRLGLFTGLEESGIACPEPAGIAEDVLAVISPDPGSPLLASAALDASVARTAVAESRAQNYPKVLALASVGDVDKSRLVPKQDYSGGFAVVLPLFEGFRVKSEIRRAQSLAAEKDDGLVSARLSLDELNARYDEDIAVARVELEYLEAERQDALEALAQTRQRYRSFLGPLVEVREAVRNLARIMARRNDARADLLLALASKAVLNGGFVPPAK